MAAGRDCVIAGLSGLDDVEPSDKTPQQEDQMATTPFSLLGIALFVSAIALPVRLGASGEPTHDVEHDHASHTGRPQSSTLS